jgi:hypothetical protein
MRIPRTVLGLVATLCLVASARGGVTDTPLPTFSDGKAAQLVALLPGVIKKNQLDTDVTCTNLAPAAVNVGLEVFDQNGVRGNQVASGNGALLAVGPGRTVTIATGGTAVLHEDAVITLEAPVTTLANGSARVVATDVHLACTALAVDSVHTVVDPRTCPTCKPPTLAGLHLTYVAPPTPSGPCPATPSPACRKPPAPGRALLLLQDRSPGSLDTLIWKWTGTGTAKADFGDPTTTASYQLCLYDQTGGTATLRLAAVAPAGGTCGSLPCWLASTTGFQYADPTLTHDGLGRVLLKAGPPGAAKLLAQGRGSRLPRPVLPLTPPVTVQLSTGGGVCWDAVYTKPITNDAANFKAKSD